MAGCWPQPPWVMGGPRPVGGNSPFFPPLPKSRLLARFARLESRSPVMILACSGAEPPAGVSTSPNRAAPAEGAPAAGDWLNTEKSETNDAELGCWAGNPSNTSNPA